LTFPVPIAHLDKVRGMPGVEAAVPFSWFGGLYEDEKIAFAQFGTDPMQVLDVMAEYRLPPEQVKAWQGDRTGCVVGAKLAESRGWKLGDLVRLKGDIYPVDLELTVRGIYDGPSTADRMMLWFHWDRRGR
jgi:putative ABC transport system permease protein